MSLPLSSCDVAVIGLGAMGSAAIYQLAKRGARVVGIDRFSPPHTFGSSHGETRITREAVGEGADYAPLVRASHRIWRELEGETGEPLLVPSGTLVMASASAPNSHHGKPDFLRRTVEVAQSHAIPHELLDAAEIRRRFPAFVGLRGDEQGYFEPGGGYVRPEAAIRTQIAQAVRLGAHVFTDTRVTGLAPDGSGVRIETDGGAIHAGQVVVAVGPWVDPFLGPALTPAFRVQRQVLHWLEITEPALFPAESPVFIWMHGDGDEDYFYGFPPAASLGSIKVATEQYATSCDPETVDRSVSVAEVAAMHAHHIAGKLGGVAPRATRSSVCLYTTSRDNGFLIDHHPDLARVLLVSACSGHGFKHSAGIGEAVARHLLEPGTPLSPAFAAGRLMAPRS